MRLPRGPYTPGILDRAFHMIEQAFDKCWQFTGDVDHPHGLTVRGELNVPGIHNNAGTGGATAAAIASGTYTPTLTNAANLDGSTAYVCQWLRVGNVVTVSGRVDVDPTVTATYTELGVSLPVASNLGAANDCGGVAASFAVAGQSAAIFADTSNNWAAIGWTSVDTSNRDMAFTFTYLVV